MPMISSVLVVHPEQRAAEAIRYAFEREDARVTVVASDQFSGALVDPALDLVVVGAADSDQGETIVRGIDAALRDQRRAVPVVYVGDEAARERLRAAGADEVVPAPALLRDVVTIGRLLSQVDERGVFTGELADVFGVYYLVRALMAVRRSGVLGMARGLRRGELHIDAGEITSAQVGMLHGAAAFHQLLLWTEAQFELRPGQVLRRHEIPLTRQEVLRRAERFLFDMQALAPQLSPAWVCERDEETVSAASGSLPGDVREVLQLFDGERTVADVGEDSPYRLIDTFRIAAQLSSRGLIYRAGGGRVGGKPQLEVEAWLSGNIADAAGGGADPVAEEEWVALSPSVSDERGELSPVVPALVASGEIILSGQEPVVPDGGAATETAAEAAPAEETERAAAETAAGAAPAEETERAAAETAAASEPPETPQPPQTSSPEPASQAVFTDEEEAFFARGVELAHAAPPPVDNFEDLAAVVTPSFWQRLFRPAEKPAAAPASARSAEKPAAPAAAAAVARNPSLQPAIAGSGAGRGRAPAASERAENPSPDPAAAGGGAAAPAGPARSQGKNGKPAQAADTPGRAAQSKPDRRTTSPSGGASARNSSPAAASAAKPPKSRRSRSRSRKRRGR